jgi:uncharacterized protein (DUF1697 family)
MKAATRYVAFLRAINVGGHVVTMDALRTLFTSFGATGVETFIASGNVIFSAPGRKPPALERALEDHLKKALGYEVRTFIRTGAEVAAIAKGQPFDAKVMAAATVVSVGFIDAPLDAASARTLKALSTEVDTLTTSGREIYWACKCRQSESALFNVPFDKLLKTSMTFRNMNTVRRITAKFGFI